MDEEKHRIVQLTDWLPPEFSAVSLYNQVICEREARAGHHVTMVGLRSVPAEIERQSLGGGVLTVIPIHREKYEKNDWARRLAWSLVTNVLLMKAAWPSLRQSQVIRFTGSPPFLLHFVFLANLLLRKQLIYRITDFYPECIIAAINRRSLALELTRRLTNLVRRRIGRFEAIGEDMKTRLVECGIDPRRIILSRDASPVTIGPDTPPLPKPASLQGKVSLLYSGNWGVAHDIETFFEGYRRHHQGGTGTVMLWLNATGAGAEALDRRLSEAELPFLRQTLVPLDQLASLLVSPDAHLVTLKPSFMGYVLPSKIYGCIASGKPILFVGPEGSDVHRLSREGAGDRYQRVDVGDPAGFAAALEALAIQTTGQREATAAPFI